MSLTVTKNDLLRHIGRKLGFSRNPSEWSPTQLQDATDVLDAALRRLYEPNILPGEREKHQWSFLMPTKRFQFAANEWRYTLPADFAMLNGPIAYARGEDTIYPTIDIVGPQHIYKRQQRDDAAGRPSMAAVEVKAPDGTSPTRYELIVYPTSDADYELSLNYRVNPYTLANDADLPLGGQPHSQTLISACLAECAVFDELNDGQDEARFIEQMRASISHDRRLSSPETLGTNTDGSDGADYPCEVRNNSGLVPYNGNYYQ